VFVGLRLFGWSRYLLSGFYLCFLVHLGVIWPAFVLRVLYVIRGLCHSRNSTFAHVQSHIRQMFLICTPVIVLDVVRMWEKRSRPVFRAR
jgi:hypothetical protein